MNLDESIIFFRGMVKVDDTERTAMVLLERMRL